MRGLRQVCVLMALTGACNCSSGELELFLDLKTDVVPGTEFHAVRTEWFDHVPRSEETAPDVATRERSAPLGSPFDQGLRVAEFSGLEAGRYYVRIRLIDANGQPVLQRLVLVRLRETSVFTVLMTRDCQGVMCPGPDDDPSFLACVGGQCVDPRCTEETPEYCGPPICANPTDCVSEVSCARSECVEGVCLSVGRHDACGPGQWCNPDRGCLALDGTDGGTDAGVVDATTDAPSADSGSDSGAMDATTDAPSVDSGPGVDGGPGCIRGTTVEASMATEPLDWNFNGDAFYDGTTSSGVLNPASGFTLGTIIYQSPIVTDSFVVSFQFKIGPNSAGDGMGFMIQTTGNTAVNGEGGLLGMGGLGGYGVELDTYENTSGCDTANANHVAIVDLTICSMGSPTQDTNTALFANPSLPVTLSSDTWFDCTITWTEGTVSVTIDGAPVITDYVVSSFTPGTAYYFGFAGSAGFISADRHEIRNVTITFPTERCL